MPGWSLTVALTEGADGTVTVRAAHTGPGVAPVPVPAVTPAAGPGGAGDRIDALADALTAARCGTGRPDLPAHLGVVVGADADRDDFLALDEAAALAGLPAPAWVPEPVAVAGERLAARLAPGDGAVVLDVRDAAITAWPLERRPGGVAVGGPGPVLVTDRIDALLTGVLHAAGRTPEPTTHARPEPGRPEQGRPEQGRPEQGRPEQGRPEQARQEGARQEGVRQERARRRRAVRAARRRLAAGWAGPPPDGPDAGGPAAGGVDVSVLDPTVFDQAVVGALGEVMDALAGDRRVAVEVVADGPSALTRAVCDLLGARAITVSAAAAPVGAAHLAPGAPPVATDGPGGGGPGGGEPGGTGQSVTAAT